ncbi:MAG TPA: 2-iminoacetate synthase ThiH [Spirochaetota bacterium]|nr:2-iminoacetate synthase ThiH [Spirochaetota bacterium]HOM39243.1 2-iminoacetate synthase ThiH [Spirochaetota bacterium]HPQ48650.1 2-iminoacetate synthase ThiH [Spirochaetota bacterium]
MFSEYIPSINIDYYKSLWAAASKTEIQNILYKNKISIDEFAVLLSPISLEMLKDIAYIAREKTIKKFGYNIGLYTPLYLSNYCVNACSYCSFNCNARIIRKHLTIEEVEKECKEIKKEGFDNILLVSGEDHEKVNINYLIDAVKIAKKYFSYVAIEVYPLEEKDYKILRDAGLDGVTLYQETYNREVYKIYHKGPKANYSYRLDTMDRAARGGIKRLNIASLFGLNDWREEAIYLAHHINYLRKNYWNVDLALSFPRIRPNSLGFKPLYPITDKELVLLIASFRLLDDSLSLVLSTRESESFRNGMIKICVNNISAGSKTNPGGHLEDDSDGQFVIADNRTSRQIYEYLRSIGYEPVWKDWEKVL